MRLVTNLRRLEDIRVYLLPNQRRGHPTRAQAPAEPVTARRCIMATGKCKQPSGVSMLVRKTVLAAAFAISSSPTLANYLTGKDLYADCSKPQGSFSQGFCSGYVSGVVDAIEYYQVSKGAEKSVCVPKEASIGQVKEIVVRFLTQHPDPRNNTASSLVSDALRNTFPCKN